MATEHLHRTPWPLTVIEISTGHSEWIQILRNWTMEIIPLGTENSVTTDQIFCMNFFNCKK